MGPKKKPVEPDKYNDLKQLIESLTHSGKKHLNQEALSKLLLLCQGDNDNINQSYKYIFQYLEKNHAEIRFSATQVCHEFFMKFEVFQKLVIADIRLFFQLTMGIQTKEPLPPPVSTAKELKKIALQYFLEWHKKFSSKYIKLKVALRFLDEIEHVDFRTFEIVDPQERSIRDEKEKTVLKLNKAMLDKMNCEMEDLMPEIRCTLTSLDSCFELLLPSPVNTEEFEVKDSTFGGDMRLYGIVNPKHTVPVEIQLSDKVQIRVDDENSAIIDAIKDAYTLINNRFLPKVKAWIEIIIKGEGDTACKKNAISLKKELESAIIKYNKLHIIKEKKEEDDEVSTDSDLEEVHVPKPPRKKVTFMEPSLFSSPSEKKKERKKIIKDEDISKPKPGPSGVNLSERKEKLLKIAPKLPFDIDLYHWEDEKLPVPTMIATNSEGARFWCGGDEELLELPVPDGVSSLRTRVIEYSGEWKPVNHICKAPLPSGKLCPRQDRLKCPFHGLIVERDDEGKIINKDDEEKVAKSKLKPDVPDWQDPKLLAEIKTQTGFDLKMPEKGKKTKNKKKKYPGLTDLKEVKNTPTNRISKKIFNKKAVMRVAATLDKIDHKKHRDKFGDQFNYVHGT